MTILMDRRETIRLALAGLGAGFVSLTPLNISFAHEHATTKINFFSKTQLDILNSFADCLLPKTETPGALDVGVPHFIAILCQQYLNKNERELILEGIANIAQYAMESEKKAFTKLNNIKQTQLLVALAERNPSSKRQITRLRQLVLLGYFTSEKVGKEVTQFLPIPGQYDPCMPLSDNHGKAWTI